MAGFSAQVLAQLLDSLIAAATASSISIDPASIFMEASPVGTHQVPYLVVRLPSDFEKSQWSASQNQRDSHFTAAVSLYANVPPDGAHPFGDASTLGILNIFDQLHNAIDNARGALQTATSPNRLLDYQTQSSINWTEDPATATITITIDFWFRYIAGSR